MQIRLHGLSCTIKMMRLVLWLSLIFPVLTASAQKAVIIDGTQDSHALGNHMSYLEDPDKALSLEQVQKRLDDFQTRSEPVLNFGYTRAGYWIRFQLHNSL